MAASKVVWGSGTAVLSDPPAGSPANLIVIDFISVNSDDDATASPLIVQIATTTPAQTLNLAKVQSEGAAALAVTRHWDMDFSGGLPIWSASDSSTTPAAGVSVNWSVTGGSTPLGCVGYHYEQPSFRRT